MNRRTYLALFLLGLCSAAAAAALQTTPGYMDASYYYAGGLRLAEGFGFSEPFLWNYLAPPPSLPHPSHAYWMPLASLLAGAGIYASGQPVFAGARLGFILAAACIPPLTAGLSITLNGSRKAAQLSGLLAAAPGFYLPFLTTTDTFGLYMLLGGGFVLIVARGWDEDIRSGLSRLRVLFLGLLAGAMHLARADGLLWLGLGFLISSGFVWPRKISLRSRLKEGSEATLLILAGYLIVMGPWMARNLAVFGTPVAPGGGLALWLLDYDELFAYPAEQLTPYRWLTAGLADLIKVRLWAAGQNLLTALSVQGEIFLVPLVLAGFWGLREKGAVRVGVLAWLVTLGVMTLVFPHQGARGGFYHSGAALQPLVWAVAPTGLDVFVRWGGRWRGWQAEPARAVFSAGLVGLAVLVTVLIGASRLVGMDFAHPVWDRSAGHYVRLEAELITRGANEANPVLVVDPPGYWAATRRPAIAIPNGDVDALLYAARKYGARYLLLEINHPSELTDLYARPMDLPGLQYLGEVDETHLFLIRNDPMTVEKVRY